MLKYRKIEYIKRLYRYHSRQDLYSIMRVYAENGKVEILDEILKITDNDVQLLLSILEIYTYSKKNDLNIFIKYLKQFINLRITACFVVMHHYYNKEILEFFKELFKHTIYPSRSSYSGGIPVKYIYTLAGYESGINDCYMIPLDHLLATIEKFSQLEIETDIQ